MQALCQAITPRDRPTESALLASAPFGVVHPGRTAGTLKRAVLAARTDLGDFFRPVARFFLALLFLLSPAPALAAELHPDISGIWRAKVVEVHPMPPRAIPGTNITTEVQLLTAEFVEGPRTGERVEFENDFTPLAAGDYFYLNYFVDIDGRESYSVREPDRRSALLLLALLFAVAVVLLGGLPGLRALMALGLSLALIVFILLPLLLAGYPPLPTSIGLAVVIVGLAMRLTHGITRAALAAFLGAMVAVVAAGVVGTLAVRAARLSGFAQDEAIYLNISTLGSLDIQGFLLSAIIIGALGVLDDVAITQASAVEEINAARQGDISASELYRRVSRIGREHIGAVVNTLALAYVGTSLPLLLLFSLSEAPSLMLINQEIFATEIVRTVVGSIALTLAVPATTLASIFFVKRFPHWQSSRHLH